MAFHLFCHTIVRQMANLFLKPSTWLGLAKRHIILPDFLWYLEFFGNFFFIFNGTFVGDFFYHYPWIFMIFEWKSGSIEKKREIFLHIHLFDPMIFSFMRVQIYFLVFLLGCVMLNIPKCLSFIWGIPKHTSSKIVYIVILSRNPLVRILMINRDML